MLSALLNVSVVTGEVCVARTIRLADDVADCLVHYSVVSFVNYIAARRLTRMDSVGVLVRDLDAEFLFIVRLGPRGADRRTSSIAMTTSTVSRLSRPRSFAKCEDSESCH